MADFTSILNKTGLSKPPQPLPIGTYLCIVDGAAEQGTIGKNQTPCFNLKLKPMQAMQDVDQQALAEVLDGKPLGDKRINHRLFITEDAAWRMDKFFHDLGLVEKNAKGEYVLESSRGEYISMLPGRQVAVTIGHRPNDDGTAIFQEVKDTARF